jgi:predicted DNA binding CopG/RHH family protein
MFNEKMEIHRELWQYYNRTEIQERYESIIEHKTNEIWELHEEKSPNTIPYKTFIREIFRRSRTTEVEMVLTIIYIIKIKEKVGETNLRKEEPIKCKRRMLLAARMIAQKFARDESYKNTEWKKITGLSEQELLKNELKFLEYIQYNLYVSEIHYWQWYRFIHEWIYKKYI